MSLNDTAATEVMEWEKADHFLWKRGPVILAYREGHFGGKPFTPDSTYTDAMLVRDKAVERYAEWCGSKNTARSEFVGILERVIYPNDPYPGKWDEAVFFASPAQITEASIALVRRMK